MANRTISLSPIADLIRKKIVDSGQPFSVWVEEALLLYNTTMRLKDNEEIVLQVPKVPWNYTCQKCMRVGVHWTVNCDWYGEEE